MISIWRICKRCKRSTDHFQNTTVLWGEVLWEQSSFRDINTWLVMVWSPGLWPVFDRCKHKQAEYLFPSVETVCQSLLNIQTVSLRHSSWFVAAWKATKSVIHMNILRVKWLQSRLSSTVQQSHCEAELRNRTHPLSVETQPTTLTLMPITFFWSQPLCLFLFVCSFPQTYHSLREITDPSMWDT